jgi:hypothetical protein
VDNTRKECAAVNNSRNPPVPHHPQQREVLLPAYDWWLTETTAGRPVRPVDLAAHAGVTYSAAANAIRRYRAGRTPTAANPGLSARTVASVHVMLRRAFRDATTWHYIPANPVAVAERRASTQVSTGPGLLPS